MAYKNGLLTNSLVTGTTLQSSDVHHLNGWDLNPGVEKQ